MIYDQIQSGKGIKDDHMVPLGLVKESCGPAIMMEPFLKQVNGHVVCCLYCGDGFYEANSDEVSRKLCAMVEKNQTRCCCMWSMFQLSWLWTHGCTCRL